MLYHPSTHQAPQASITKVKCSGPNLKRRKNSESQSKKRIRPPAIAGGNLQGGLLQRKAAVRVNLTTFSKGCTFPLLTPSPGATSRGRLCVFGGSRALSITVTSDSRMKAGRRTKTLPTTSTTNNGGSRVHRARLRKGKSPRCAPSCSQAGAEPLLARPEDPELSLSGPVVGNVPLGIDVSPPPSHSTGDLVGGRSAAQGQEAPVGRAALLGGEELG